MKMYGSNRSDTLIGTASRDMIQARGGNDLIATAGGADTILADDGDDMITGFSFKLPNSGGGTDPDPDVIIHGPSRAGARQSTVVDGGDGSHDVMLVELTAAKRTSEVDDFRDAVKVRNVEEFIYNFGSVSAEQKILGSNSTRGLETIVVGSGNANIDLRSGNDHVYTADGDDVIKAGKGSDFIHAGNGHNIVTGGSGADYFHFHLTNSPQYTEITDFQEGVDKVVISIDVSQVNLLFDVDAESPPPVRTYGDRYLGVGSSLNAYVSYNHGREFDADDFETINPLLSFSDWAAYDQSTGSIFIINYQEDPADTQHVLVAQVTPGTEIDASEFSFRMI
jgi:Ca2+-binding RTX toxin-like protein